MMGDSPATSTAFSETPNRRTDSDTIATDHSLEPEGSKRKQSQYPPDNATTCLNQTISPLTAVNQAKFQIMPVGATSQLEHPSAAGPSAVTNSHTFDNSAYSWRETSDAPLSPASADAASDEAHSDEPEDDDSDDKPHTGDEISSEDERPYQKLFPLSPRPWLEPIASIPSACPPQAGSILPPEGMLAEASCIVDVMQAERAVRVAEQRLAKCRVKEHLLKTRLYKIQAAMANRLVQVTSSQVGRALAGKEDIEKYRIRPNILHNYATMEASATEA